MIKKFSDFTKKKGAMFPNIKTLQKNLISDIKGTTTTKPKKQLNTGVTEKVISRFNSKPIMQPLKPLQSYNPQKKIKKPKPKKQFVAADKPIYVYNEHPIPSKKQITKVYDKIPDDTNIPLKFMTRQQYVKKYVANQEIKNNTLFKDEQKQEFYNQKKDKYSNIVGRYTTKNNPYIQPAVVMFNDPENQKNIKGKKFEELAWHEYGHELAEKKKLKLSHDEEEYFADRIAEKGMNKNPFCDTTAKNKILQEIRSKNEDEYYGGFQPPLVNTKGSVADGRHRILALKNLGYTEIPIEIEKDKYSENKFIKGLKCVDCKKELTNAYIDSKEGHMCMSCFDNKAKTGYWTKKYPQKQFTEEEQKQHRLEMESEEKYLKQQEKMWQNIYDDMEEFDDYRDENRTFSFQQQANNIDDDYEEYKEIKKRNKPFTVTKKIQEFKDIKKDEYSENKFTPKIEKISPFDVKTNYEEYEYNPSSAETVENMEKHIKSGGKLPPILISEDGELIDGRHRLRTYKLLNKDIPVIRGESPYASQIIKKGKELKIGKGNIEGQPYAYEIEDKETILSDEYSENKFTPNIDRTKASELTAAQKFGARNLKGLQKIGAGRDRDVYALDDDKVIKIAKNPGGLTQNQGERDIEYLGMGEQYEQGKDYVVMKKQKPLSKQGKQKLGQIRKVADEHTPLSPSYRTDVSISLSGDDSVLDQTGIGTEILDFQPNPQEVFANRQWGEDEEGNLVLLDGGALQDNESLSRFRVKHYKPTDWQSKEWQETQRERKQYKDKGTYDKERKFERGYMQHEMEIPDEPLGDEYSKDKYEEQLQEFITNPTTNKGLGRCGEAAQCVVNEALKEGVPQEDIQVLGVQRNHPFKVGLSNHMVANIQGKYYDPTRTQYGQYDQVEFDELPPEYKKVNIQHLEPFIKKDGFSKDMPLFKKDEEGEVNES